MKLIIMTNNAHKLSEISDILSAHTILSYKSVLGHTIAVDETGSTFKENATLKVNAMPEQPNAIVLAEDSGIVVDALDGQPGVHSARYAGDNATDEQMCDKLLDELGDCDDRTARYVAVMAVKFPDGTIHTVEGRVEGTIAHDMRGDEGFGYDPIFIPTGHTETFSELGNAVKHQFSHRKNALNEVAKLLKQYSYH
ncbi:MAG: RdgB/HAM1 family non-canonical purine NTP pyrophosphatase [bacterium]|nr:RdgB/HAM1 family non-canonical purine NTP pyrophosphatase [bacterium]